MDDSKKPYKRQLMINGEKFSVDVNVEVPPPSVAAGVKIHLAKKMEHGESVLFDTYSRANSFGQILKKAGFKYVQRKDVATGKFRVWKIDPEKEKQG